MHLLPIPTSLIPITLLALLTASPTTAAESQPPSSSSPRISTLQIYHLPSTPHLTPPTSKRPLATLSYSPLHPHLSRLTSLTPPKNSTSIVQIGFCFPTPPSTSSPSSSSSEKETCRTTATYAYTFHPPYTGRFKVLLGLAQSPEGERQIISIGYKAWPLTPQTLSEEKEEQQKEKRHQPGGTGDFDIKLASQAPGVWVDRAIGAKGRGGAAGGGAGEKNRGKDAAGEGEEEVDERTFLQKYWWVILAVTVFAMAGGGADK